MNFEPLHLFQDHRFGTQKRGNDDDRAQLLGNSLDLEARQRPRSK